MRPLRALPAAVLAAALAGGAAAELPSFDERFKGIPLDRCKEIGGPPTWVKEGPQIVSVSAGSGRAGDVVAITTDAVDAAENEVHFLWKGTDVKAPVESARGAELRVRVPGMGALKGKQSGWLYLSRGAVRGKAKPFQFLPAGDAPAGPAPSSPAAPSR